MCPEDGATSFRVQEQQRWGVMGLSRSGLSLYLGCSLQGGKG